MGHSFFALGDDAEARRVWIESLRAANEMKGLFIALDVLAGLARLQAKQGNQEQALELLLIVLNHPASSQETKNRADHLRTELEAQLTPKRIEAIQVHAKEITYETIVEDLLK